METIFIKNRLWRVVEVEKSRWLKMIAKKEATEFFKSNDYLKLSKAQIIDKLTAAKIPFDELTRKDELIKLLPN